MSRVRQIAPDQLAAHREFAGSPAKHILMLTTHGMHQWEVVPGLPDTGGQNVFVNQFSAALADLGFKLTIVNRGGYAHPQTGIRQEGLHYKDERQRLLYLEDGLDQFVRKEDMGERIPALVSDLMTFIEEDGCPADHIISHYWDAATVGLGFNRAAGTPVSHVWIPHSLGQLKKRHVSPESWPELRIDERIEAEKEILSTVDAVAATSTSIHKSLLEDYGYEGIVPFLPPCIDTGRYHPREIADDDEVWEFLSRVSGLSPSAVRDRRIVMEISRTDPPKRKDVLIKAFAKAHREHADSLLIVSIDDSKQRLSADLRELIDKLGVTDAVAVVGTVWERLPKLYAITDIYCTPSVMEGFGMSAQEAAATAVPVVASHRVPFATEYLLGDKTVDVPFGADGGSFTIGEGAIVVEADEVDGFVHALLRLLSDQQQRRTMGKRAYRLTIPYFTWPSRSKAFLDSVGMGAGEE